MNKPRFLDYFGMGRAPKQDAETLRVMLGGDLGVVEVKLRRNPRARRLSLRVEPALGGAVLTLPKRSSRRAAEAFVMEHADWLAAGLSAMPPEVSLEDGTVLEVLGRRARIRHCPERRSGVEWGDGEILVSGQVEHLPRRLKDFLKKEARVAITPIVLELAEAIGKSPGRVTLRDTRSRWGSCSARGDLSFSWRLIFAPPAVLRYVVAHEVAHLKHMDHSKAFWATVTDLHPTTDKDRDWLRENGAKLHRVG